MHWFYAAVIMVIGGGGCETHEMAAFMAAAPAAMAEVSSSRGGSSYSSSYSSPSLYTPSASSSLSSSSSSYNSPSRSSMDLQDDELNESVRQSEAILDQLPATANRKPNLIDSNNFAYLRGSGNDHASFYAQAADLAYASYLKALSTSPSSAEQYYNNHKQNVDILKKLRSQGALSSSTGFSMD